MLAMTPGIGGKTVSRILARNDLLSRSPEEFLRLCPEAKREEYRLSLKACAGLNRSLSEMLDGMKAIEERLDKHGVTIVTLADAHYPQQIEEMDGDPPGALFLYGNARLLNSKTFAVMSSRNTSTAGLELMESLAEQGVLSSEVLVTGDKTPEYERTAIVPLRWGSPRVLCLDRGLFVALGEDLAQETFAAARLWRYQFDEKTDLAISPFRPEAHFVGVNNQLRDRLVASLSRRLDLVEVASGGNMEKLARMALKCKRPVRISDRSLLYRSLAQQGATILEQKA
jgi:DNA processing protein